jgi:hypothetical protein
VDIFSFRRQKFTLKASSHTRVAVPTIYIPIVGEEHFQHPHTVIDCNDGWHIICRADCGTSNKAEVTPKASLVTIISYSLPFNTLN